MATDTAPHDTAPPPRRWGRAMVWLAAIVLLVGVALAVSFLADDDAEVLAEPPTDQTQFCDLAAQLGSVSELSLDGTEGVEQLRALELTVRRLATLSPQTISADFVAIADALRATSEVLASLPPDATDRIARVTESLDAEFGAVADEAEEATAYVERWCGPLPSTTTSSGAITPTVVVPSTGSVDTPG